MNSYGLCLDCRYISWTRLYPPPYTLLMPTSSPPDSTLASLTAELSSHPSKLSELVMEGRGEGPREELVPRKRGDSVSEIIEDTFRCRLLLSSLTVFRDKSIASSFGGKEEVTQAAIEEVSTREEVIVMNLKLS